jgi:biotin operon repressor
MRFAPPNPLRIADRASGLNAVSVRSYNERLVLSLLLQNSGISRVEIGERTGLSAQTVSVIVRSLEQEGLIAKGQAQRGRVGPPTIPISLNPEGAFSIGISIGHRTMGVALVDFVGAVRFYRELPIPAAKPGSNHGEFFGVIEKAIAVLPVRSRDRIAGIGLALPDDKAELALVAKGAPQRYDALQEEIEQAFNLQVFVQNDITAAAGGESMFGSAKSHSDYLFVYLGARLHTRLILNHQIYNATRSLSYDVGLLDLEREILGGHGGSTALLWDRSADWPDFGAAGSAWRSRCVEQIKAAVRALSQFIPVKTVVLSSYAPRNVCVELCELVGEEFPELDAIAGSIEKSPKAVGAASLPYTSRFMVR